MQATVRRHRPGRGDLRVVSAGGITAEFVAQLAVEKTKRDKRPSWFDLGRLTFGSRRVRRWLIAVGLMVAAFAATILLNVGLNVPGSSGDDAAVGSSAVAEAGCGFGGVVGWSLDQVGVRDELDEFCDTINAFVQKIKDNIVAPIVDGIWAAFHQNRFCKWRTELEPEDPNGGLNSLMTRGVSFLVGADPDKSTEVTTWEQYGTAGAYWDTYYLDCFDSNNLVNYAANFMFDITKLFAIIAILLFQQTFSGQIVDYFFTPQGGASQAEVDRIMERLNADIYLEFFAAAVVIGAAVIFYRTIIRGSGLADGLSKAGLMAFVAGLAVVFVLEGSTYVREANEATNEVGATVLGALAGTNCTNSDGENVNAKPYSCAAQTLYDALIFRPWAGGNIGELELVNDRVGNKDRRELAIRILKQNAYTPDESRELANSRTPIERRRKILNDKKDDRLAMLRDDWGVKYIAKDSQNATNVAENKDLFDPNSWRPYNHVRAERDDYWKLWSGGEAGQRVLVAGMAFIAAMTLGMMMMLLSAAYLVLQLMTILLAMAAPLVFLVALIPIFGFTLLLRWATLFIGTFIKRVAMVVFIGIILAFLHIIFAIAIPWWMQLILVIGVCMVGLAYRRQFTAWATGNMTGAGQMAGIMAGGGLMGALQAKRSLADARKGWQASSGLSLNERAQVAMSSGYASLEGRDPVVRPNQPMGAQGVKVRPKPPPQPPAPPPPPPQRAYNAPIQYPTRPRPGQPVAGQQPGYYPDPYGAPMPPPDYRRNSGYVYQRDNVNLSKPQAPPRARARSNDGGG